VNAESSPPITWQARNFDKLELRTWEDETFVFNPASGDTHLLNEVALAILQSLSQQPTTLDTLATQFLEQETPESRQVLIDQLQQLELVGLIRSQ
jgi:PqqD family protein of HPr-rel-A system